MKKLSFSIILFLLVSLLIGCSTLNNSTPVDLTGNRYKTNEFIALLKMQYDCDTQNELAKKHPELFWGFDDDSYPTAKLDDFIDITPNEAEMNIGCQIFKNKTFPLSFILFKSVLYPIAEPLYGSGILDIKTCDFDSNGQIDLIYSVSASGSGIYTPMISCFNFTNLTETKLYSSRKFEDYMLKKLNNLNFDIYIIENELSPVEPNTKIFDPSTFSSNKKIGSITSKNNIPTIHFE